MNVDYFLEAKKSIQFKEYLGETNNLITYDGSEYVIIDKFDFSPITSGKTTEEIYSYIIGWGHAKNFFEVNSD